jgi:hypothetical protein
MGEWTRKDFTRRHYQVEGGSLDKARRVEVHVIVDGRPVVQVQAREPGILAFVSKPTTQGFDIEIIEHKLQQYTDVRTLSGDLTEPLEEWQYKALDL